MNATALKSILVAIVAGIASIAPLLAVDTESRCIEDEGIPVVADEDMPGLVEARLVDEGKARTPQIAVNPLEIELTYFSPETVDFLFERECARLKLEQVDKEELTDGQYHDADCAAIKSLGFATRQIETVMRDLDLAISQDFWPQTMGPPTRPLDLRTCL